MTLVLMAMVLLLLAGQMITSLYDYNATPRAHGEPLVTLSGYLAPGHPWETLFDIKADVYCCE